MEKIVNRVMSRIATTATIAVLILLPASITKAEEPHEQLDAVIKQYLAAHPDEVGEIVKDYVVKHPDIFMNVLVDVIKRRPAVGGAPDTNAIPAVAVNQADAASRNNAAALFGSAHQVTLGNPNGDVTMVEFFDYNCGYCRGALPAC